MPNESPMEMYRRLKDEASWFDSGNEAARDLDETRRLLYMALLKPRSDRWYNLAGTLVNALAHHGLGIDPDEAIQRLTVLCGGDGYDQPGEDPTTLADSEAWARGLINRITAHLGGVAEASPDAEL